MRLKYTRVNILRCANFTRGKQMTHSNANTHRSIFTYGKFTPGSDQMQILFLQIHTCKSCERKVKFTHEYFYFKSIFCF